MTLNVRIDLELHARLVQHVKHSNLTRAQIVEGALVRLFGDVDRALQLDLGITK